MFISVDGKMVKWMDKAGFSIAVVIFTLESSLRIQQKVKVPSNMLMVQNTLEGGNQIYSMDMELKNGKRVPFTRDISLKVKKTDKDITNGLINRLMMETGR